LTIDYNNYRDSKFGCNSQPYQIRTYYKETSFLISYKYIKRLLNHSTPTLFNPLNSEISHTIMSII